MNYGSYESTQCAEVSAKGEDREVEILLTLECATRGDPGCMYTRNGDPGWPPEAAEFELESIHLVDDESNPVEISEEVLTVLVGGDVFQRMIEDAEVEANESGEF